MAASNMSTSKFKWNMKKQIKHSSNATCCPEGSGGSTETPRSVFKFRNHPSDFIRSKGWRYKFNSTHLPVPPFIHRRLHLKQLTTKCLYSNIIQQHIQAMRFTEIYVKIPTTSKMALKIMKITPSKKLDSFQFNQRQATTKDISKSLQCVHHYGCLWCCASVEPFWE